MMVLDLSVLVVGTEQETRKILSFLNQQEIPLLFHELGEKNNFDAQTPVAYCGQYQAYGERDILEKTPNHYFLSKRN